MLIDVERWERKYKQARGTPPASPDAVLSDHRTCLDGEGWALDVACGRGANTGFLASLGYQALGIDCSWEALDQASHHFRAQSTHWLAADFVQFFIPRDFFRGGGHREISRPQANERPGGKSGPRGGVVSPHVQCQSPKERAFF